MKNNKSKNIIAQSTRISGQTLGQHRHEPRLEDHTSSFSKMIDDAIARFNGTIFRNGGRPLIGFILRNIVDVGGKVTKGQVKLVAMFAFRCYRIWEHEGTKGLVLTLKASHVLIQQAIGGYKVKDMSELKRRVRRSRSGLPKWIPVLQRRKLLAGDPPTIRFWTSLVALYRVLEFEGQVSVSTIITPGTYDSAIPLKLSSKYQEAWQEVVKTLWFQGKTLTEWKDDFGSREPRPFPISKASPTTRVEDARESDGVGFVSSSPMSVIKAARYWVEEHPDKLEDFASYLKSGRALWHEPFLTRMKRVCDSPQFGSKKGLSEHSDDKRVVYLRMMKVESPFLKMLGLESAATHKTGTYIYPHSYVNWTHFAYGDVNLRGNLLERFTPLFITLASTKPELDALKKTLEYPPAPYVGRLGLKNEPAGKVRVFAMVDPWTQWLLRPLHDTLFSLLRKLPTDATFDQVGVLEKVQETIFQKKYRRPKAFSFDLSAATDRLPVSLQTDVLQPLLGRRAADAWKRILIDRPYRLPDKAAKLLKTDSVKYSVGQPMGALSSWAMLALTHHFIVQIASYQAWKKWPGGKKQWRLFTEYVVLGDDIVIFNHKVAMEYYHLMTKVIGVKIGLAKSIQSKDRYVLEFAKKYWVDGKRAFMLPIRDIIVANLSTAVMTEFMNKHEISFNSYLKMRGLGHKSRAKWVGNLWKLSSRLRVYTVLYLREKYDWWDWIALKTGNGAKYPMYEPSLRLLAAALWKVQQTRWLRVLDAAAEAQWYEGQRERYWPVWGQTIFWLKTGWVQMLLSLMRAKEIPGARVFIRYRPGEPVDGDPISSFDDQGKWRSRTPSIFTDIRTYLSLSIPQKPGEPSWRLPMTKLENPTFVGEEIFASTVYPTKGPFRFEGFNDPKLSREDLLFIIKDLRANHEKWAKDYVASNSAFGWLNVSRTEEKRYTRFISTYREWVMFNTAFVKGAQLVRQEARLSPSLKLTIWRRPSQMRGDMPLYPSFVRKMIGSWSFFEGSWAADLAAYRIILRRLATNLVAVILGWSVGTVGLLLYYNIYYTPAIETATVWKAVSYNWEVEWLDKMDRIWGDFNLHRPLEYIPQPEGINLASIMWNTGVEGIGLSANLDFTNIVIIACLLVVCVSSILLIDDDTSFERLKYIYEDVDVTQYFELPPSYPLYNHFGVGVRYTTIHHPEGAREWWDTMQYVTRTAWQNHEVWMRPPPAPDILPVNWWEYGGYGGFNWAFDTWNAYLPNIVPVTRLLEEGDRIWVVVSSFIT